MQEKPVPYICHLDDSISKQDVEKGEFQKMQD